MTSAADFIKHARQMGAEMAARRAATFWQQAPWGERKRAIRTRARSLGHELGRFSKRKSSGTGDVASAQCTRCGVTATTWSAGDLVPYGASSGVCDRPCEGGAI